MRKTLYPTLLALLTAGLLSAAPAAAQDGYTRTRYPIVLAHGLSGFDDLAGLLEYFYGIPGDLRAGGAQVYVTEVSQFNSTSERCLQLVAQVENIVAISGAGKVNLIGHSHGGLDSRCVAKLRPDLIASVTTVGSPHKGADLATFLRPKLRNGSFTQDVYRLFAESLGVLLAMLSGSSNPQDAVAAIRSLSATGMARFNERHPWGVPKTACGEGEPSAAIGGHEIRFYSWSGTAVKTNGLDFMDTPFALASKVYKERNDGLVGRCSSHFGQVLRDNYPFNHLDEVNQMFGLIGTRGANPKTVFRTHANRLQNAGL